MSLEMGGSGMSFDMVGFGMSLEMKGFGKSCLEMVFGWRSVWCRASELPRDYDGACLQMRLSYVPAAHFLLFLVQWTDCSLAGALGLLHILIYKVCAPTTVHDCHTFIFTPQIALKSLQGVHLHHLFHSSSSHFFLHWVCVVNAPSMSYLPVFSPFPFSSFVSKEGVTLMMQVYMDGTTTMSTYERKASFHEFYGMFVNGGSASLEISVQSAMLDTPYSLCLKLLIWLVCETSDLKFFPGPWQLCRNWTWRC